MGMDIVSCQYLARVVMHDALSHVDRHLNPWVFTSIVICRLEYDFRMIVAWQPEILGTTSLHQILSYFISTYSGFCNNIFLLL